MSRLDARRKLNRFYILRPLFREPVQTDQTGLLHGVVLITKNMQRSRIDDKVVAVKSASSQGCRIAS